MAEERHIMGGLNEETVAAFGVEITGIERSKADLAKLQKAITHLRSARYVVNGNAVSITHAARSANHRDRITFQKMDNLEKGLQGEAEKAMMKAMAHGRKLQKIALNEAVTKTGAARYAAGTGGSAGRNKTGELIEAIGTDTETKRHKTGAIITGWYGWGKVKRYYEVQEGGSYSGRTKRGRAGSSSAGFGSYSGRGVPAANSLGYTMVEVWQFLRRELMGVGKRVR